MLLTIGEFVHSVDRNLSGLIDRLTNTTGRSSPMEIEAWRRSLPKLSTALSAPEIGQLHLQLGDTGGLALEYRLPASSAWCDAVILGKKKSTPGVVMIELKDWHTKGDGAGPREGLILHNGALHLHPSEQVRGYVEYCRMFHSAVLEAGARVNGCVYFTSGASLDAYRANPHQKLSADFPIFSAASADLSRFVTSEINEPDPEFARSFERGQYRQDRNFVMQVAKTIQDPNTKQFVLLDEQRAGFEHCMRTVDDVVAETSKVGKAVVIVEGPPGSGKSVLAAQLWAQLALDERLEPESVVLVTTSGSQRSNWEKTFQGVARLLAGRGLVKPANTYNPGLSPAWIKAERAGRDILKTESWKDNIKVYLRTHANKTPDNAFTVSIVDEAHALIDPTKPGTEGNAPSGWSIHAGPQGWHIIRASRISVFLMDSGQSYRDNETTTPEDIEKYAADQGVKDIQRISLADAQFRCGGSKEYVDWLDTALGMDTQSGVTTRWRTSKDGKKRGFGFEIVEDPMALEERLREHMKEGASARLVASYARKWLTKDEPGPHKLPDKDKDFHIPYRRGTEARTWSKVWNYAPKQDYTQFIQAPPGSAMAADPLCEIGCPYVVRGFDYDYLGVLWLSDLVWRTDHWVPNPSHVHESAWRNTLARVKHKSIDGALENLSERLRRGYRILLSRAIKGVYLWFEDAETRAHVESLLRADGAP